MDWKTRIGLWWFDYVHFPFPLEDGEDEGRLGKWENENGESVNPMEIVE